MTLEWKRKRREEWNAINIRRVLRRPHRRIATCPEESLIKLPYLFQISRQYYTLR